MEILGVSAPGQPSAACLLRDGKILAAAREDRFSRRIDDRTFPLAAIAYCLRNTKIGPADLSAVVLAGSANAWREHGEYPQNADTDSSFRRTLRELFGRKGSVTELIARDLDPGLPVLFLESPRAETAGFFASPFEEATVLRIGESGAVAGGRGARGEIFVDTESDLPADPMEAARELAARAPCDSLVLVGHGATEALAERLENAGVFANVWAHPAGPSGVGAIGAALHFWCVDSEQPRRPPGEMRPRRALGPEYNAHQVRTYLRSRGITPEELPRATVASRVADLLAENHVVAWFQGRIDLGDDTIASRSVLISPRAARATRAAGSSATPRADASPLSPHDETVIAFTRDSAPDAVRTHLVDEWRDTIGHEKASVFLVDREDHRAFHDLLTAFHEISGVPALRARPLRIEGEPIACAPGDAYDAFLSLPVDALVIGPYLLRKTPQEAPGEGAPLTERGDSREID